MAMKSGTIVGADPAALLYYIEEPDAQEIPTELMSHSTVGQASAILIAPQ